MSGSSIDLQTKVPTRFGVCDVGFMARLGNGMLRNHSVAAINAYESFFECFCECFMNGFVNAFENAIVNGFMNAFGMLL